MKELGLMTVMAAGLKTKCKTSIESVHVQCAFHDKELLAIRNDDTVISRQINQHVCFSEAVSHTVSAMVRYQKYNHFKLYCYNDILKIL